MKTGERLKPWTRKEECRLEALLLDGLTHRAIGVVLGRTEYAINHRASLKELRGMRRSSRWVPLFMLGLTAVEISARLGVTMSAVWLAKWRLKRLGFVLPITRVGRRAA